MQPKPSLEELMNNLPKCKGCGKPALGLAEGQPSHLCMNCFNGKVAYDSRKRLLKRLRDEAPSLSDDERWGLFALITEDMCSNCFGPTPCHCKVRDDMTRAGWTETD